jgi:uncharacterized membrane protein
VKNVSRYEPLIWLGMLAYLGFYVFGIVMGVFSPFEMIVFTLPAIVFLVLYLVYARSASRAIHDPSDPRHDATVRAAREQRERRGW